MAKRRTIAEMALAYRRTQRESEFLSDMHWRAGYLAGARANRISAAQRRVVEAADYGAAGNGWDRCIEAIFQLHQLERAKGDRK